MEVGNKNFFGGQPSFERRRWCLSRTGVDAVWDWWWM